MHKKLSIPSFVFFLLLGIILLSITHCIEEYSPNVDVDTSLLAIDASIVRGQVEQSVIITRSSSVENTLFIPVGKCLVAVIDDKNNVFQFEEQSGGKYTTKIDSSYLHIGAKFKLIFETPDRNIYESEFEEIIDCPPVDSLYFLEEMRYSKNKNSYIIGLRLNVDIKNLDEYSNYYRWKVNETWEIKSKFHIDRKLLSHFTEGGKPYEIFKNTDSLRYCWKDDIILRLFSSNTLNMKNKGTKRVPLQYVFEYDERLYIRYSCLVSQYSLSEDAYIYWNNKKIEVQESGSLYTTQPSQSFSNIKNINNPGEVVLGYFWTSTVKQKRVFFDGPLTQIYFDENCELVPIDWLRIPVIYVQTGGLVYKSSFARCFDCRLLGGTLEKPDFW